MVAGLTGVRTVDVGSPQWAMHSVRECMATSDVYHGSVRACDVVVEDSP